MPAVSRRVLWAVAVPAAALALLLMLAVTGLLVPETVPVDQALFLSRWLPSCHPEPREQLRYVLAITLVPLVLGAGAVYARHRGRKLAGPGRWDALPVRLWAQTVPWLVCGFVVAMAFCDAGASRLPPPHHLFRAALACGAALLAWRLARAYLPQPRSPWARHALEVGAWLLALLFTAVELLPSIVPADQPFGVHHGTAYHFPFYLEEFAAVLNGHTPLVDFYPQYQNALPYALAPVFRLVGLNPFTFSVTVVLLSGAMLLLLFGVLRLATGGAWSALALYLPLLWISFTPIEVMKGWPHEPRWNAFTHFAIGPFRLFGPCLTLAFLTAYLRRASPLRLFLLFFVAGVTAVNNLDFGLPALGAALVATLCTTDDGLLPRWRTALRLLAGAGAGACAAGAAFLLLTWLRSGRLPEWRMATAYQRAFAVNGFGMLPMPRFGLHWVVYLTFMAALGRGLFDARASRLWRGLCLYSGVFGAGALMYYVGRSHEHVLVMVFPAWALSLAVLAWLCLRDFRARRRAAGLLRALTPAALLFAAGYVGVVATLADHPNIGRQAQRLAAQRQSPDDWPPPLTDTEALVACVRAHAQPGEGVGIITPYGHLAAGQAGVWNVFPFSCPESLILRDQLLRASAALEQGRVRYVFLGEVDREVAFELARLGFRPEEDDPFLWTRRDRAGPARFWWQWEDTSPDELQQTACWCGPHERLVVYNPGPEPLALALQMRCASAPGGKAVLRIEAGPAGEAREQAIDEGGAEVTYEFTAPVGPLVLRLSCDGPPVREGDWPAVYHLSDLRLSEASP